MTSAVTLISAKPVGALIDKVYLFSPASTFLSLSEKPTWALESINVLNINKLYVTKFTEFPVPCCQFIRELTEIEIPVLLQTIYDFNSYTVKRSLCFGRSLVSVGCNPV